jgi:CheY-like chemotaxis protein
MTALDPSHTRRSRTGFDVAASQLAAIERFTAARRSLMLEEAGAADTGARELRMDAARRLDVLKRQQAALVAQSHEQLQRSGEPLSADVPVRAVLAHRSPWFVEKVSAVLRECLIDVVATPANGADAVGIAVAEQPELLLVEDSLEMLSGEEVVRELREFCPEAVIAAQVAHTDRVAAMLEAGASAVFGRQIPPVDVAVELRDLVIGP